MASQYDFQSLERELTKLERELDTFEKTLKDTVNPINDAKFNENEYGQRAIEKKIDTILNDSKKRISRAYNDYINGVRRATHSSLETIKSEARGISDSVETLNGLLRELDVLNKAFSDKQYGTVIEQAKNIQLDSFDSEVRRYILFLQLESYEMICRDNLSAITIANFADFKCYYALCESSSASKHMISARKYLLEASNVVVNNNLATSTLELYSVCRFGMKVIDELSSTEKDAYSAYHARFYERGISAFNELSQAAYEAFDYTGVKQYLSDASTFKQIDINVAFFKDGIVSPQKMFAYMKEYGHRASEQAIRIAFEDTKSLSVGGQQDEYLSYWLCNYDRYGIRYVESVLGFRSDKYDAFTSLCDMLSSNRPSIKKYGACFLDAVKLYESNLMTNKQSIAFYKFLQTAVAWNKLIKGYNKSSDTAEAEKLNEGIKTIDSISVSMIVKYRKICCNCDRRFIDELNAILDDASKRLVGKPYLKNLKQVDRPTDENKTITVKLVTLEMQKKKKNFIIWSVIGTVLLVAGIVLLIVLLK